MVHSTKQTFKKNDFLIDYGQVFKVTCIKTEKVKDGEPTSYIYYKSHFNSKVHQDMFCSIPENQVTATGKRKPISKKEAQELIRNLSEDVPDEVIFDELDPQEILGQNDIFNTATLIKLLWLQKHDSEVNFSPTKQTIYQEALEQITQEIALVLNLEPKLARKKILQSLRQ